MLMLGVNSPKTVLTMSEAQTKAMSLGNVEIPDLERFHCNRASKIIAKKRVLKLTAAKCSPWSGVTNFTMKATFV